MTMTTTHSSGLWGAVPIYEIGPLTSHDTITAAAGSIGTVHTDTTFAGDALGNTGASAYTIGDIVNALKLAGILAF